MARLVSSKVSEALDRHLDGAVAFLADMIREPSVHGEEAGVQRLVAERFADLGAAVSLEEIDDALMQDPEYSVPTEPKSFRGRPNVLARIGGGGGGRRIILNAHSDVVPATQWPEAFQPVVTPERVVGRGAADDKGQVAVMALVLAVLKDLGVELKGEVINQIVIDEEVGGNGSLALIRQGGAADGVIVMEGTDLKLYPANRGALWFRLSIEGRSTHMGKKWQGVSAVDQAMEAIKILYKYEKELIRSSRGVPLFTSYRPPPTQVNVGMMSAGDWPATVPARAVLEGGVGFLPNRDLQTIKRELREILDAEAGDWLKDHYTLEFPKLHNDAYVTDPKHPLVRAAGRASRRAALDGRPRGWIVSCDARLFARVGGLPTVCFGAGNIDQAHSNTEHVLVADMRKAAEMLIYLLADWCNRAPAAEEE